MFKVTVTNLRVLVICGCILLLLISCRDHTKSSEKAETVEGIKKTNPVVYFEIPVTDMNRAIHFYKSVFEFSFQKDSIDNHEMALFPFVDQYGGISGALAKGEIYKPTIDGVVIYFKTANIDATLKLATENGAHILYAKTDNGLGYVAEFQDSEGNRIALYESK
jgi:predicted enzyme related to lactoylglutathione lyase